MSERWPVGSIARADDYIVTVCSACLRASCWLGQWPCEDFKTASTVDMPASQLRALGREHQNNYSRYHLLRQGIMIRSVRP